VSNRRKEGLKIAIESLTTITSTALQLFFSQAKTDLVRKKKLKRCFIAILFLIHFLKQVRKV
jgi:hypothetical protein